MTGTGKVHAASMAQAVRADRQFQVPHRPRFIGDLAQVWGPDYLLVDGTGELQILRGRAVSTMLASLIPVLDGDRTMEQVAAALPAVRTEDTHAAVALLYTRGLLEDAETGPHPQIGACGADTVSFFRRHLDATRVNRSANEALHRLARSHVYVLLQERGAESLHDIVAGHLRSAGVAAVTPLRTDLDLRQQLAESRGQRDTMVIALIEEEGEPCSMLSELDRVCAEIGIPWLRSSVSTSQGRAEIGPYFESGVTPCYGCFDFQKRREAPPIASADVPHLRRLDRRLWVDMLALEAICLLSRIAPAASGIGFTSYDTASWSAEALRLVKIPGCSRCRPGPAIESADEIAPALRYEDAIAFPPRHLVDPKAHQAHYHIANVEMTRECKTYPGVPVLALPPLADLPKPTGDLCELWNDRVQAPLRANIDLEKMAALLLLAGGVRDRAAGHKLQRWVATGGNLGSVELYVAAADVDGLEAGLYYYDSSRHGLAPLPGTGSQGEVAALIRAWTAGAPQKFPAVIVAVAAFHRVFRKYGPFAYRLVHLDAGVALAQVHLVARSLGIATSNLESWIDDSVVTDLRLSEEVEYVTAMVGIGASEAAHEHA